MSIKQSSKPSVVVSSYDASIEEINDGDDDENDGEDIRQQQ